MSITQKENELIEEFDVFDDWMDKYEYIIDLGKDLPKMSEDQKTAENLIRGCQSQVWLTADYKEGRVYYNADSDAIITKGLISMLVNTLSEGKPEEILSSDMIFLEKIGLHEHLSPTRSNGLLSMIKQMKAYALAYSKIENVG